MGKYDALFEGEVTPSPVPVTGTGKYAALFEEPVRTGADIYSFPEPEPMGPPEPPPSMMKKILPSFSKMWQESEPYKPTPGEYPTPEAMQGPGALGVAALLSDILGIPKRALGSARPGVSMAQPEASLLSPEASQVTGPGAPIARVLMDIAADPLSWLPMGAAAKKTAEVGAKGAAKVYPRAMQLTSGIPARTITTAATREGAEKIAQYAGAFDDIGKELLERASNIDDYAPYYRMIKESAPNLPPVQMTQTLTNMAAKAEALAPGGAPIGDVTRDAIKQIAEKQTQLVALTNQYPNQMVPAEKVLEWRRQIDKDIGEAWRKPPELINDDYINALKGLRHDLATSLMDSARRSGNKVYQATMTAYSDLIKKANAVMENFGRRSTLARERRASSIGERLANVQQDQLRQTVQNFETALEGASAKRLGAAETAYWKGAPEEKEMYNQWTMKPERAAPAREVEKAAGAVRKTGERLGPVYPGKVSPLAGAPYQPGAADYAQMAESWGHGIGGYTLPKPPFFPRTGRSQALAALAGLGGLLHPASLAGVAATSPKMVIGGQQGLNALVDILSKQLVPGVAVSVPASIGAARAGLAPAAYGRWLSAQEQE